MYDQCDVREAVHEFQEYLSDRLPPLMALDSVGLLLLSPAALMADEIGAWAGHQRAVASESDLLYHCVKKVCVLGELELVPRGLLAQYLRELSEAVLPYCPEDEREQLRHSLSQLGHGAVPLVPTAAQIIHRQHPDDSQATAAVHAGATAGASMAGASMAGTSGAGTSGAGTSGAGASGAAASGAAASGAGTSAARASAGRAVAAANAEAASAAMTAGLRRLTLVLERLQALTLPAAGLAAQRSELAAQFVATAASEAKDQRELDSHLAPLRQLGIATDSGHVFRALAGTLAGWGTLGAPGRSAELEAMRQLVRLSGDPVEAGARLRELVHAAIEQFNDGHLGRAGVMFGLAEELMAERPIAPAIVESLRQRGSDQLAPERLARYAEREDCRPSLRRVLDFFVSLRPQALLQGLDGERSRDRRRLLLALLEAHGAPARAQARERLRAYVEGTLELDPYSPRNLVYLLQAVPRPDDVPLEEEVQLVTRAPGRLSPVPLVKQVIAYLSATRHERAERALVTFLHVFETMLLQPQKASYAPADVDALLDRTCVALARYGTPRSWKALVDHGLQAEARTGATLARLAEAGRSQDLSASPEIVGRLLAALAAELPRKLLGFSVRRNDERVAFLIQALSGTPSPAVLEALQAVVDRYPGQKIAEEAQRAMATLKAAARGGEPPAGLAGDLELFGLPDVLQTLAGARQTGVLTLMSAQGAVAATVLLEAGRFRGGQCGAIEGHDALYQLFERPFPGTFAFVSRRELPAGAALVEPCELVPLMLEGMRRHDELRRAAALVPDGAAIEASGAPWSPLPDEDAGFAEQLWQIVAAGTSSEGCEAAWATDSYRVRRLLAHWAEEGALRIAAAASAQAPATPAAATEPGVQATTAAAEAAEPAA